MRRTDVRVSLYRHSDLAQIVVTSTAESSHSCGFHRVLGHSEGIDAQQANYSDGTFCVRRYPSPFETYVATKAKQWLIYGESRAHAAALREPPASAEVRTMAK